MHTHTHTHTLTSNSDQSPTAKLVDASKQNMSETCYLLGLLFILSCLVPSYFELLKFDAFLASTIKKIYNFNVIKSKI